MPAQHYVDNDAKLIITTWEGNVSDSNLIEALKLYQADIQNNPEYYDYCEIVNLSNISLISLSIKGLKNIGKTASTTDPFRAKTKLAFIVSSNLGLNLVRLYTTYRNFGKSTKKKIRAFKTVNDARRWLHDSV